MRCSLLLVIALLLSVLAVSLAYAPPANIPTFPLYNTAVPGLTTPAIGVGFGGYAFNPAVGYGGYPECFDDASGCDVYSARTLLTWLELGGRRLDTANTYGSDRSIGRAIQQSGVPRKEIWILSKIGPGQFDLPLGYNDTLTQFRQILRDLQTEYVDLLLIHWPTQVVPQSMDPHCRQGAHYDERLCRLSTWRAMLEIFDRGQALSVGVSNFNITHLQEIADAGLRLPSVNQCPFHLYRSSSQTRLRDYCRQHNITFWGYSPLGVPDWQVFPTENTGMSWTPMEDPAVVKIAAAHGVTPAQVLLQWQYSLGIPTNPRSQHAGHMRENLQAFSFSLTEDEISTLNSGAQDVCVENPGWYECAKNTTAAAKRAVSAQ